MIYLIFDTETTGFPNKNTTLNDPSQPYLLQLAWLLFKIDEDGQFHTITSRADYVSIPPTVTIAHGAFKAHGIGHDLLKAQGKPLSVVMDAFLAAVDAADGRLVAHNFNFDVKIINIALARLNKPLDFYKSSICTMLATTTICKLPGQYGKYKWPKLAEAYKHFTGKELVGAHNALVDVKACFEVFRAMPAEVVKEWTAWQE